MRNYKSKNVHTKPSMAGRQNISEEYIEKHKDKNYDPKLMGSLRELFDIGCKQILNPRKSAWTAQDLITKCGEYFLFTDEKELKPTKSALQMFIGLSRQQASDWINSPERYGDLSDILSNCYGIIENQYVGRGELYPTFNMFLLRSKFNYVEKQEVEVTTFNSTSPEQIADAISKLGLDRPTEKP